MTIPAELTPYNVPAKSVLLSPELDGPLYPFEKDQLQRLIQQVESSPERVKSAFFAHFNRIGA